MKKFPGLAKGSLKITIKGSRPEELLNRAWEAGIELKDLAWLNSEQLEAWVDYREIRTLRHLARTTACRFHLGERRGLVFAGQKIWRRKFFYLGAVLAIMGLFILGSLVWEVKVELPAHSSLSSERVRELVHEAGVKPGVWKSSLDAAALQAHLENSLPQIFWVGVQLEGGQVLVQVAEKTWLETEEAHPVNIVAAKTGLVEAVLVQSGTPLVAEGEVVERGQILISGRQVLSSGNLEETGEEQITWVQAKGTVRAKVWYENYGEAFLQEEITQATSQSWERTILNWGQKRLILQGEEQTPEDYQVHWRKKAFHWRNLDFTVEIIKEKYLKLEHFTETRTPAEAQELARQKALAELKGQLADSAEVLNQDEELFNQEPGLVRVKIKTEVRENIGLESEIKLPQN